MEELLELKIGIATSILYLAMLNASDDEIKELRVYGERFKEVMNEVPADIEKIYSASMTFNEHLSKIAHNRMQERLGSIVHKIATFTRHKALEVSVERGLTNALPDNYLKEVSILEARDKGAIAQFMDERLKLWQELETWQGGTIRRIRPSVILLERGQIFSLGGKRFFTMGGASSHDIQDGILEADDPLLKEKCRRLDAKDAMYRINHLSWWKEELPSEEECQTARANLDRAGWEVDYITTHCCPSSVQDTFSGGLYQRDALTDFFDEVSRRCQFKYWFLGHYHENIVI